MYYIEINYIYINLLIYIYMYIYTIYAIYVCCMINSIQTVSSHDACAGLEGGLGSGWCSGVNKHTTQVAINLAQLPTLLASIAFQRRPKGLSLTITIFCQMFLLSFLSYIIVQSTIRPCQLFLKGLK